MGTGVITYLSGASGRYLEDAVAGRRDLGLLVTPDTGYITRLQHFAAWAADNACFNQGDRFDLDRYLEWLESPLLQAQRATCLWATAPDVVGDAEATWRRSEPVLEIIRSLGYPVALVGQDGFDPFRTDWDRFDVLFLGGTTEWKLSRAADVAAAFARERGKLVHMGRVNSGKRLRIAAQFGCGTADGTFLAFGPRKNLPRLLRWLDEVNGGLMHEVA